MRKPLTAAPQQGYGARTVPARTLDVMTTAILVLTLIVLLAVVLAVGAVAALALLLRRRLREMRHLPDLGRRFVTRHEEARVTGISHEGGGVTLHVASGDVQTMVLDEGGAPDHVTAGAARTSSWRIPATARLSEQQAGSVQALLAEATPVRIVSSGVVGLAGPVATGWRLEASNGLVLSSGL